MKNVMYDNMGSLISNTQANNSAGCNMHQSTSFGHWYSNIPINDVSIFNR